MIKGATVDRKRPRGTGGRPGERGKARAARRFTVGRSALLPWTVGIAAITVGAVCVIVFALSGGGHTSAGTAPSRARQYSAHKACLLTDARGISADRARTVWAGMEDASAATHAKVQYLSTAGPATPANAIPYANTLVQRHCDIIVATGEAQAGALRRLSGSASATRFLVVDAAKNATDRTSRNLEILRDSRSVRSDVRMRVEAAVGP